MQYDDDFDEEEIFSGQYTNKTKYKVQVQDHSGRNSKESSSRKKKEPAPENEDEADFDRINHDVLSAIDQLAEDEEDEDDMLDAMARFVEGQDT